MPSFDRRVLAAVFAGGSLGAASIVAGQPAIWLDTTLVRRGRLA